MQAENEVISPLLLIVSVPSEVSVQVTSSPQLPEPVDAAYTLCPPESSRMAAERRAAVREKGLFGAGC